MFGFIVQGHIREILVYCFFFMLHNHLRSSMENEKLVWNWKVKNMVAHYNHIGVGMRTI